MDVDVDVFVGRCRYNAEEVLSPTLTDPAVVLILELLKVIHYSA
jgi:hypothetical protein